MLAPKVQSGSGSFKLGTSSQLIANNVRTDRYSRRTKAAWSKYADWHSGISSEKQSLYQILGVRVRGAEWRDIDKRFASHQCYELFFWIKHRIDLFVERFSEMAVGIEG